MSSRRFAVGFACVAVLSAVATACGEPSETSGTGPAVAAIDSSSTVALDQGSTTASLPPTAPSVSPPPPRTFIDEEGHRCLEYETSAVNRAASGVCFDDEHDELGIRTVDAGDHYPNATIIGGTDDNDAVRVIIGSDGTEHAVDLIVVEGWPERIFVADLPDGVVEVRLEAEDGRLLSSTTV